MMSIITGSLMNMTMSMFTTITMITTMNITTITRPWRILTP